MLVAHAGQPARIDEAERAVQRDRRLAVGAGVGDDRDDLPRARLPAPGQQLAEQPAAQALAGAAGSEVQEFPWGLFVFFADPDGNRWSVQQIPARG